ncbi:putative phosphoenolpyruvate carboxylase [Medicago truncatula]|uniref:Putative phosphoenolpyruvate carboxylase n=1 Tax=Medicago truncatula TaxID=3880 RepID=A0A396JEZ0_MEDTR|nr:putative phosphoenolpyruvate carboxylase [Medicago truncatula]
MVLKFLLLSEELHRSSKKDAKHYIAMYYYCNKILEQHCCNIHVILGGVRDKLYNTRECARQLLANGTSDIVEETTFANFEQVLSSQQLNTPLRHNGNGIVTPEWKFPCSNMLRCFLFLEPLELCYRSLCACGDRSIADRNEGLSIHIWTFTRKT